MSATAARQRPLQLPAVAYSVLTLIIVAAAGFTLWYRAYYNIWPGQDATARVHWCERDYRDDGPPTETWRQITAESRWPVHGFGRYPPLGIPGQELFAAIYPGARPSSCATVVYVRTGPGKYQSYSLLGGPLQAPSCPAETVRWSADWTATPPGFRCRPPTCPGSRRGVPVPEAGALA